MCVKRQRFQNVLAKAFSVAHIDIFIRVIFKKV